MDEIHRSVATSADMHALGREVASHLRGGDTVVLTGDLGAGKTTLTRGIGEALDVRGAVTSPTFVIARTHPREGGAAPLVHVDAYRLGDAVELDDLDIDFAASIVVIEWGKGLVDALADNRLEIDIERPHGSRGADLNPESEDDEPRTVRLRGVGERWAEVTW